MATAYCTDRELKDVYPQVDSFDNKKPIYGWESLGAGVYIARNTGLITQLFQDGKELSNNTVDEIESWVKYIMTGKIQTLEIANIDDEV